LEKKRNRHSIPRKGGSCPQKKKKWGPASSREGVTAHGRRKRGKYAYVGRPKKKKNRSGPQPGEGRDTARLAEKGKGEENLPLLVRKKRKKGRRARSWDRKSRNIPCRKEKGWLCPETKRGKKSKNSEKEGVFSPAKAKGRRGEQLDVATPGRRKKKVVNARSKKGGKKKNSSTYVLPGGKEICASRSSKKKTTKTI